MKRELVGLFDESLELLSLPEICLRVNSMIDQPCYSMTDIAAVIHRDVALTTRLLKLVNSSLYSDVSRIDTVSRAMEVIARKDLQTLISSTAAVKIFTGLSPQLVDMTGFWRQAIYAGVVAEIIAKACSVLHKERLFIGGLLHEVGHLAMYAQMPVTMNKIYRYAYARKRPLAEVEQELLGFDYAMLGVQLLQKWKLPDSLQTMVRHHLMPEKTPDFLLETAIVHLACGIAREADLAWNLPVYFSPYAWSITRLAPKDKEYILSQAGKQFSDVLSVLVLQREIV